MADTQPNRLRSVLRLAKRNEETAMRDAANAGRESRSAGENAETSRRRLDALTDGDEPVTTADEFVKQRQRATLRADQSRLADEALRERLQAELEARDQLRGAVRRRRSLEELEGRRLATQASLAAQAAQRALDELASMRRREAEER